MGLQTHARINVVHSRVDQLSGVEVLIKQIWYLYFVSQTQIFSVCTYFPSSFHHELMQQHPQRNCEMLVSDSQISRIVSQNKLHFFINISALGSQLQQQKGTKSNFTPLQSIHMFLTLSLKKSTDLANLPIKYIYVNSILRHNRSKDMLSLAVLEI